LRLSALVLVYEHRHTCRHWSPGNSRRQKQPTGPCSGLHHRPHRTMDRQGLCPRARRLYPQCLREDHGVPSIIGRVDHLTRHLCLGGTHNHSTLQGCDISQGRDGRFIISKGSQVQGSTFRVKDRDKIEAPKSLQEIPVLPHDC